MPQRPNKLAQFWQELKRRRVVHVITVYASVSFVLLELVNNLTEPLNLPPKLATIAVVVLAVGFPLAVILAWIYDLTPEGIEKTKPVEETEGAEQTKVPNAWRIATDRWLANSKHYWRIQTVAGRGYPVPGDPPLRKLYR